MTRMLRRSRSLSFLHHAIGDEPRAARASRAIATSIFVVGWLTLACTPAPEGDDGDAGHEVGGDFTSSSGGGSTGADVTTASAEPTTGEAPVALVVESIAPAIVDPIGGSRVVLAGSGFTGVTGVTIGGAAATELVIVSDTELRAVSGAVEVGAGLDVVVARGADVGLLAGAVEAWSPAELAGARLFDAAVGVAGAETASRYEWAKLTDEIAPDWRIRDGNTTTWLPATNKFWMVGGWNGDPVPEGFSDVPEDTYPPRNTTNEVWSSPDGVAWTLELPHDHPQWERRHGHSTVLWRDRLWMIGGDHHQGKYNHDVVSGADGVNWQVEVVDPPWQPRALQFSGVYDDRLWMAGGQDLVGPEEDYVYHNDVWSSVDGVNWVQVVGDAPASATRWAGRSMVSQLVEFKGRMWLVGGATYTEALPRTYYADVWSTTDGATWTEHTAPGWQGVAWHDVAVFDGRMWILFGGNGSGNLNQIWYTDDGEVWTELPADQNPTPTSHAQGVAVGPDFLLYAGGNYTFEYSTRSTWRLKAYRGVAVEQWTDRGADAIVVSASEPGRRPVAVPDAFGAGIPGLQFDGNATRLDLPVTELQPEGRSIFWVGRAPWTPSPDQWDTPPLVNPLATVVGDNDDTQSCAAGLAEGGLLYTSAGVEGWQALRAGSGLSNHVGEVHFAGIAHEGGGIVRGWIGAEEVGAPEDVGYSQYHGWSRIGAGGYAPIAASGFSGSLGAVVILPYAAEPDEVARMHAWAQGRFGVP